MIAEFNEVESQSQLGPLLPAGDVTTTSFYNLGETIMKGYFALME